MKTLKLISLTTHFFLNFSPVFDLIDDETGIEMILFER